MNLFDITRTAHIVVGFAVLGSFWGAAFARKGGALHRRMGRIYVFAMAALLAFTLVMATGMALNHQVMRAVFNVYVALISVCSVWMTWNSIQHRNDVNRYRGLTCKLLCGAMGAYGLFLLSMVPRMPAAPLMAMATTFAVLGLVTCGWLARRIVIGADHPRWWLSEHLTGMALNFGATHASFSILGLGVLLPAVKEPWNRVAILAAWMVAALLVRLWAGRRFLASHASGEPAPSGARGQAAPVA